MKKKNIPGILELVIFVVSVIIMVIFYLNMPITMSTPIMDISLWWAYLLVFVAVILCLGFSLAGAFKSKKTMLTLLLGIVAVVVICGACYMLAPGGAVNTKQVYTQETSKLVDAGLYLTYFMLGVTVLALIFSTLAKNLKK